jgi:hypothetical protein
MNVRLRLAIVVILVAGGAVVAGFALWPSAKHVAACTGPTVAPLSARAQKALNAYADSIRIDTQKTSDGGRNETRLDPVTGASRILSFDNQGRLTSETGQAWAGKTLRSQTVFFGTRSWLSTTTTVSQAYTSGDEGATADSLDVRKGLADGSTTSLGHAVIDGHTTLHLRHSPRDLWVDPLTYLPIRTQVGATTDDITWLPRTAANLLSTKIVVPQGFKRSPNGAESTSTMQWTTPTTCAQS